MEIKITTHQILKVLQVISWIIFIGLCIEAGSIIVSTIITLFITPQGVHNYWDGANYLTGLYQFDKTQFIVITVSMIIVAVLKAILFYLIIKMFVDKELNLSQPFSMQLSRFLVNMGYLSLGIGLFSHYGYKQTAWMAKRGLPNADLQSLHIAGADVWLFMAVILFVIVQIVKRGIELQTENDLTI